MHRRIVLKGMLAASMAAMGGKAFAQSSEIRIGCLSAASGPAAFLGASEKNQFDLMVEQFNAQGGMSGHKIVPFYYDTEGNSTNAAQQFRRLAESDKVHVVVGPSTTGESMVLKPIADELKIPMITMTGTEALVVPPTRYVFKVAPTDRIISAHMLSFAKSKGWSKVGIISSADGFGQAGAGFLKSNAEKLGVKIVLAEEFGPRDTDMTPQILRIRRAEVDAMLIWSVNPGPTIILKNAAASGFNKPIVNSFGVASTQLLEQAGATAENTYVSTMRLLLPDDLAQDDPLRPVISKVAANYRARFKAPATTFVGHPYDAMTLIELALKKAGKADREALVDAIHSGISFPGCNGEMNFSAANPGGQTEGSRPVVMVQIKAGKFTIAE